MFEVFVPRENVNDDSVIIRAIHVKSGELVKKAQLVLELETSKTNIDVESPEAGVITHNLELGDEVYVGALLFRVGISSVIEGSIKQIGPEVFAGDEVKISTAAAKRAKELSIDPAQLGVKWVSTEDIEQKYAVSPSKSFKLPMDEFDFEGFNVNIKKEKLSKRKQAEIKSLQLGKHEGTSSTVGINIAVPGARIVPPPFLFENSISDLIVFEGSRLLKNYPELNSTYINSKTFAKYEEVNFGWSFDSGGNLKVLAIKKADELSLLELQNEVVRLLEMYESSQNIPIDLLQSSTITISDLSKKDATFMLPLINGYQSLILGVVRQQKNFFTIYATFDHRLSEGLRVVNFLSELKSRILSYYLDGQNIASIKCYACEKTMSHEIADGYRGFVKMTLQNGDDANFCHQCFGGW